MADDEEEEEETILLVELNGVPNPSLIKQPNTPCYILGVGTDNPIIQVGGYTFKGQYKDIIGTGLIFEKITTTNSKDIRHKFVGKSFKRLFATRFILSPNKPSSQDELMEEPMEGTVPSQEESTVTKETVSHQEEEPMTTPPHQEELVEEPNETPTGQ